MEIYRESKSFEYSEDSESESSSDDDDGLSWKRRKHDAVSVTAVNNNDNVDKTNGQNGLGTEESTTQCVGKSSKKRNNIWAKVIQGQEQQGVEFQIDNFNMDPSVSLTDREVETYNYKKHREHERHGSRGGHYDDRDNYNEERDREHVHRGDRHRGKRKRSAKDRLGRSSHIRERLGRKPNVRDRLGERKNPYSIPIRVNEDDDPETVAKAIIERLREQKGDLIRRITEIVGNKTALQLLHETEDVEQAGGLMTQDGKRRRQPGGVYLTLLKASKNVTKEQLDEINSCSKKMENANKKKAEKRRKFLKALRRKQEQTPDDPVQCGEGESSIIEEKISET
ncbi:phosphorylated adapter RNA export protein-like [Saccoglossus kowalevskii]|uniref:Phosphorylated adapter RNA export protein n=1 Tax=Saccoglossus kowalevskii TaxID=10224 RepID=A0ABM0GS02_SACKO|nr:PREDICTED: phosphorylated adapter RNA export protein-like [Saccoglossus kowalevskii]